MPVYPSPLTLTMRECFEIDFYMEFSALALACQIWVILCLNQFALDCRIYLVHFMPMLCMALNGRC